MSWTKTNILTPVPQAIQDAISPVSGAISAISPILTAISTALEIAKVFITGTVDPFVSIMEGLISEVENTIKDLFGTGMYLLTVTPMDLEGRTNYDILGFPQLMPSEAIQMAIGSFDDRGDAARPQFSNNAEVTAFGLLATAPSLQQFIDLLTALLGVFAIPDWAFLKKELTRYQQPAVPSYRPDWKSLRLNSFGIMADLENAMLDLLYTMRGYLTVADNNIADLINVIQGKVNLLQQILDELDRLINSIASATGIYVMNLPPGIGGNARIKQALTDATLESPCLRNGYTVMTVFVGGGPSLNVVNTIRQLIA